MQISIQKLSKRYSGGKYALREVDLEIGSGMFGLLGPNGAGKTTLMRILVTMLEPSSGEVLIDGHALHKYRKQVRQMTGYLPQDFSVFSKLKVWEFLDYVASLNGVRAKRARLAKIDQLLEDVGLFDVRDRRSSKLSGGMKRRLGIAQTLIGDPRIMIVDEPTTGLDPEERVRFRNLLADLSVKDMIILLSTHIVGDISSTCANVALLNAGKIVFDGSPDELINAAKGKVWKVSAGVEESDRLKEKYPVISTVPSDSGYELRLVAEDISVKGAVPVDPNLEDAYIFFMKSLGYEEPEGDNNDL
ncbi:MAG: ATP-binding cassette domain-containing protein [Candidatus Aminicenantes bacterium]|nr:ATP-binding cassette domain-containing protein [Candidatus Aminicenantes bacterium]